MFKTELIYISPVYYTHSMESTSKKIVALYKTGLSAPVIAAQENLKLNTVYRSLKNEKIPRRNATEQNQLRFEHKPKTYNPLPRLTNRQHLLKVAALMLYWGEGAKTGNTVDLANSSLPALKLFLQFLLEICQISQNKLRFYLYCFADGDSTELINYWSRALKVPKNQFTKPYIRTSRNNSSNRIMPQGVLHIRYSDKKLLEEILSSCEIILNELTSY